MNKNLIVIQTIIFWIKKQINIDRKLILLYIIYNTIFKLTNNNI